MDPLHVPQLTCPVLDVGEHLLLLHATDMTADEIEQAAREIYGDGPWEDEA